MQLHGLLLAILIVRACVANETYYFYNEVTGQTQFQDPGDTPFEDEQGMRYWLLPNSEKTYTHPAALAYTWVEQYSKEISKKHSNRHGTGQQTWHGDAFESQMIETFQTQSSRQLSGFA
ncbi:WW domain-containing protein [Haematococcus lacustris]|uniref:WW domain-containing protein n=1 Tax=Haematococcus lacustris TaxID=44745 RepID=A0A699ZSE9_HAELA|nr:WW domain-containing protein [Haematococcus lacustris]